MRGKDLISFLFLLVVWCFVNDKLFVSADCRESEWPLSGSCTAGSCINETCVCDDGWTGNSDLVDMRGESCRVRKIVRTVFYIMSCCSAWIAVLTAFFVFITLGDFNWKNLSPKHIGCVLIFIQYTAWGIHSIIILTTDWFIRESIVTVLSLFLSMSFGIFNTSNQAYTFVRVKFISQKSISQTTFSRKFKIVVWVVSTVSSLLMGGCLLGSHLADDVNVQLGFAHGYTGVLAFLGYAWAFLFIYFGGEVIKDLKRSSRVSEKGESIKEIKSVVVHISAVVFGVVAIPCTLIAAIPLFLISFDYALPLIFFFAALSDAQYSFALRKKTSKQPSTQTGSRGEKSTPSRESRSNTNGVESTDNDQQIINLKTVYDQRNEPPNNK